MPAESALTDYGRELIEGLPSWARDVPEFRARCHVRAKESERQIALARRVRDNLIPARADELGLPWWESLLRLPVEPVGLSVEERRGIVLGALLAANAQPEGRDWVANVNALVGAGWTYEENDPGSYELHIWVPFAPGSEAFGRLENLIREFTPAHLEITISGIGGFILDESELDQETFD